MSDKDKGGSDKKKEKKLKKFSEKGPGLTRLKYLLEFMEKATEQESIQAFQKHAFEVFSVTHEAFTAYELQCKKGRTNEQTLTNIILVMKKLMTYLSENIKQRWHVRNLSMILEKSMSSNNKHSIRLAAFELLLYFYMDLGEPEKEFIQLLPGAIDLTGFLQDYPSDTRLRNKPLLSETALCPKSDKTMPTKDEALEFLRMFLNFMTEHPIKFDLWFNILKSNLLSIFYPNVSRQLGIIDATDDTGFNLHAPFEIQCVITDKLSHWFSNEALTAYLWIEHAPLLLEIYRQCLSIPASNNEAIKKCVSSFHDILFIKPPKELSDVTLTSYRKYFFEKIPTCTPDTALTQDHYKLVVEILNLYIQVVSNYWQMLNDETRSTILLTSLDLASNVLKRQDTGDIDRSLCPIIIEAILFLWIKTKTLDQTMWNALQSHLESFFHRKDTIAQCKIKLIQMTLVLTNFMYSFDAFNKSEEKKLKSSSSNQNRRSDSTFPDYFTLPEPKPDPHIKSIEWDYATAHSIWSETLRIFKNINIMEDPGIYLDAMECIGTVIDMLLLNHEKADVNTEGRPHISLINVFGPWLFESVKRPIVFCDGKALAMRSLCRIIIRNTNINLPLSVLSHFYDALQFTLMECSCTKVSWAVLEYTNGFFGLSLPGSNILVPYFIHEISKNLNKIEVVPEKVRESIIQILGSLMCMNRQFADLEIPLDKETSKIHRMTEKENVPTMSYQEIKMKVSASIVHALNRDTKPHHQCLILSCINTLIVNELHSPSQGSGELIISLLRVMTPCTLKDKVATTALSCLSNLSTFYKKLHAIDNTIVSKVLYQLVANINAAITNKTNVGFELAIVAHIECLLDWLMVVPPKFIEDIKLMKKILFVLDGAMKFASESNPSLSSGTPKPKKKDETTPETPPPTNEQTEDKSLKAKIKRAAEQALVYITSFQNIFPPDEHYDILQSQILDYSIESLGSNLNKEGAEGEEINEETSPNLLPSSLPPFPNDVLWFSVNNKFIYSVFDHLHHSPELDHEDANVGLTYLLSSSHYAYFFGKYLQQQGLEDSLTTYYEEKQYQLAGIDLTPIYEKSREIVHRYLSSETGQSLPPEYKQILNEKMSDRPDLALVDVLLIQFFQFKHSDFFQMSKEHSARITSREYTGKYTWDFSLVNDMPSKELYLHRYAKDSRRSIKQRNDDLPEGIITEEPPARIVGSKLNSSGEVTIGETVQSDITNMEDLLGYLTTLADCVGPDNEQDLTKPRNIPALYKKNVDHFNEILVEQQNCIERKIEERNKIIYTYPCIPPESTLRTSSLHSSKLFLKHLGWTNYNKYAYFSILDHESTKFKRQLKQLDANGHGREIVKIGLVYVKEKQEDEKIILRNEAKNTSELYNEYVEGMAVVADIQKHCGYIGGLDRSGSVGSTLLYYRDALHELVIHEVVRMPTSEKDPLQILKKRHVGNDIVHIIWSEHYRDYKPQTIVSQFNDAHIIIYPMPNGLFRIKIAKKKEVSHFGPLLHNMVVSKDILPILTKQTALNANFVVRFSQDAYMGQYSARKEAVFEIASKYTKIPYTDYLKVLFPTN